MYTHLNTDATLPELIRLNPISILRTVKKGRFVTNAVSEEMLCPDQIRMSETRHQFVLQYDSIVLRDMCLVALSMLISRVGWCASNPIAARCFGCLRRCDKCTVPVLQFVHTDCADLKFLLDWKSDKK